MVWSVVWLRAELELVAVGVVSEVEEVLVELSVEFSSCSSGWLGAPGVGKVEDTVHQMRDDLTFCP